MTARAYVLIRTAPGLTKAIYQTLKSQPMIRSVELITGPYDLIVALECANTAELMTTIMRDIRPAAGVRDTLTCLVVPEESLG